MATVCMLPCLKTEYVRMCFVGVIFTMTSFDKCMNPYVRSGSIAKLQMRIIRRYCRHVLVSACYINEGTISDIGNAILKHALDKTRRDAHHEKYNTDR
jgi:uncharacterized protein YchJ